MNIKQVINAIDNSFYTISVFFDDSRRLYTYKVKKSVELKVGDLVAVCRDKNINNVSLCHVAEIHEEIQIDFDSNIDYKWIIQKIDFDSYLAQVAMDEKANKTIKQAEIQERKRQAMDFAFQKLPANTIADLQTLYIKQD